MSLDIIDTCILSSLQENGRMPLSEIARRAGVAPATVHERLAKLRKSGIVRGFCVRLDPRLLGYTVTALIHLRTGLAAEVGKTIEGLSAIPEVEEVHVVTGEYDLVIKVRACDTEHLQQLLVRRIHKVTGIARSATEVCMTSPLERLGPLVSPPVPVPPADQARGRDAW
ncbi:MAG: Lrp/AsnC family transcriptional regulator [Thermoanaerobaculaceae bacterium]|nr:Lrp/AsnC family transcriptional regulator [Thermoanaerobaculaceae bacterium]MDI9621846.1 Lrp/AsnC family transcriptional regulator [Acidobacteriota bacterium]HPW54439.1 Lrp/AsnC family transcriptional regulator [Thermoanaerobaculaceae bacterium]